VAYSNNRMTIHQTLVHMFARYSFIFKNLLLVHKEGHLQQKNTLQISLILKSVTTLRSEIIVFN